MRNKIRITADIDGVKPRIARLRTVIIIKYLLIELRLVRSYSAKQTKTTSF